MKLKIRFYNNTIDSNDYSGIVITESSNNNNCKQCYQRKRKYGIQILNDATKSANNTIKDNTINDNSDIAILIMEYSQLLSIIQEV